MHLAIMIFYKNIIINGKMNIPKSGPCIYACTHPNSFLDAIIIGIYSPRKVYFLARSDVFNTKFKHWLLSKLNMIPIYRMQEGAENLHKNEHTFSKCFEILKQGGTILIFSEGISVIDKMVRPLKKGTARIVFGAEEENNFNLSIHVIAVGINYIYPTQFRSDVVIGFNKALNTQDYKESYLESKPNTIKLFNDNLFQSIKYVTVITEDDERKSINYETIAPIARAKGLDKDARLAKEKRISLINYQNNDNELIDKYRKRIQPQDEMAIERGKVFIINYIITNIIYIIFYVIGFLPNAIPYLISKAVTNKNVRQIEFFASVKLCLFVVLYLVYLPILASVLNNLIPISSIFIALILMVLGVIFIQIRDYKRIINRAYSLFKNENMKEVIKDRNTLIEIYQKHLI